MRIVFVAPFGLGQKTTVWARILPLARDLVRRGCTVTLLIPPWDSPADSGRTWQDTGVQVIHVTLRGGLPLITARLLRHIHRLQPDIIHLIKPRAYAGIVGWLLWQQRRWQRSSPRLLLDVDDWEAAWSLLGNYPSSTARFLDWQEQWGITHADGITAASRWLEERVHQMAPHIPVLYLPNGIEPPSEIVTPASMLSAPAVLLFSRFVEVEPTWMGEFWQALQAMVPGVQLVVGGQALQPAQEALFQAALQVQQSKVEWLGFVPAAELPHLYDRVQCAIFPAANVPLNQAKCSVRLATTLLRGVPVVASAVGEQANYGANGAAVLVAADASPTEFADAVAGVLAQPQRQRELAMNARQWLLSQYNWESLGKKLYTFYQSWILEN